MSTDTEQKPVAREARIELRMTEEENGYVQRAAEMGGETLSAFLRRVSIIEAHARFAKLKR